MEQDYEKKRIRAINFFGGEQYIEKTYPAGHPMRDLLVKRAPSTTTVDAFAFLAKRRKCKWLEVAKHDINAKKNPQSSDWKDFEAFNSILGELRAYADLLQLPGYDDISNSRGAKGPDFALRNKSDDSIVRVEVFSFPPRPDRVEKVAESTRKEFTLPGHGKYALTMTVSVAEPFGFPDPNKPLDSTAANIISQLCDVKGKEKQFHSEETTLLYIDLQSLPLSFSMLEQTEPILYGSGHMVTSGAIWYAFYGEKGYPIFEEAAPGMLGQRHCVPMQHAGRFCGKTPSKANAVLIGVGPKDRDPNFRRLVCLENPKKPLPPALRKAIEASGLFDYEKCRIGDNLSVMLSKDREAILVAQKCLGIPLQAIQDA